MTFFIFRIFPIKQVIIKTICCLIGNIVTHTLDPFRIVWSQKVDPNVGLVAGVGEECDRCERSDAHLIIGAIYLLESGSSRIALMTVKRTDLSLNQGSPMDRPLGGYRGGKTSKKNRKNSI